jgi:hypothetical protein
MHCNLDHKGQKVQKNRNTTYAWILNRLAIFAAYNV